MSYALSVVESIDSIDLLCCYEAVQASDYSKLLIAMEEEIESLQKNET